MRDAMTLAAIFNLPICLYVTPQFARAVISSVVGLVVVVSARLRN